MKIMMIAVVAVIAVIAMIMARMIRLQLLILQSVKMLRMTIRMIITPPHITEGIVSCRNFSMAVKTMNKKYIVDACLFIFIYFTYIVCSYKDIIYS